MTPVAVLGFTPFERAALEACLRLDNARPCGYQLVADTSRAQLVIADADDPAVCSRLRRERLAPYTVAIGARRCRGVTVQLPRPIDTLHLLRALDALPRAARPPGSDVERVLDALAELSRPAQLDEVTTAAPPPPPPPPPPSVAALLTLDYVLVADDSEVALRFMAGYLPRFGFHVHLARSGAEAIERVRERQFDYVFMEIVMDGIDGIQACKAIKQAPLAPGRRTPRVAMLTMRDTRVDRLRSAMAGADAFLPKPLRETDLLAVIGDREIDRASYIDTAVATLF
jgi:CheY-like chemotaxis protein